MILAACGLLREARIVGRAGVEAVAGGGEAARLEALLEARAGRAHAVLSIGIAGALDPGLRVGDWVIGSGVVGGGEADAAWAARLRALLISRHPRQGGDPRPPNFEQAKGLAAQPVTLGPRLRGDDGEICVGLVLGSDRMLTTAAGKTAAREFTEAIAVDMESHVAARVAARHRLPFAIVRVISDTAAYDLPPAVLVGMRPDGSTALGPVLGSLARHPAQLRPLLRTGIDASHALRVLLRGYDVLARFGLGLADFG